MKLFDVFRRKKKEKFIPESRTRGPAPLPSDLETFRMERRPMPAPEPIRPYQAPPIQEPVAPYEASAPMPPRPGLPEVGPAPPIPEPVKETSMLEKEDMILQKLETIDARLRLIEEKIK